MYEGRIINHTHADGRACILGPDGQWRHWDNDGVIPGPRDTVDWKCDRAHPCAEERMVSVTDTIIQVNPVVEQGDEIQPVDNREDYRDERDDYPDADVAGVPWSDRGEFGMPGIGVGRLFAMDDDDRAMTANSRRNIEGSTKMIIDHGTLSISTGELGVDIDAVTPEARAVLDMLPWIIKDFLESNEKYARVQEAHDLGIKGIIPDINRKTGALITRVWDEVEAGRDSTEEMAGDLIGHLLLLLGKMRVE